ncbi:MAG: hypothetical protein GMKNLPBB_02119 [Myxococcota bacterium]|nr:hypothetical protein [Myxococcota bacterium]
MPGNIQSPRALLIAVLIQGLTACGGGPAANPGKPQEAAPENIPSPPTLADPGSGEIPDSGANDANGAASTGGGTADGSGGVLCARNGLNCGETRLVDPCEGERSIRCGECAPPQTCGGGGKPNVCGCSPKSRTDACGPRVCGMADDGCGVQVECGTCPDGASCKTDGQCGRLNWVPIRPQGPMPSARMSLAMACDTERKVVVLYGGWNGETVLNDTWEWNGASWTLVNTPSFPDGQSDHAMTYDSARRRVILHGSTSLQDKDVTWEWDGVNWTQFKSARKPAARSGHMMAYDSNRKRTVLFGGLTRTSGPGSSDGEIWEWDGAQWYNPQPSMRPLGRYVQAMAFDAARRLTLMSGGFINTSGGHWYGDTWTWDGLEWKEIRPATVPEARSGHKADYDPIRRRVVFFGGLTASGQRNDTWEWDGNNWVEVQTADRPPARVAHWVSYDVERKELVLFGGFDGKNFLGDMWALKYE